MRNSFRICGRFVRIRLQRQDGQQLWTLINLADLVRANKLPGRWTAQYSKSAKTYYVHGRVKIQSRFYWLSLHRVILDTPQHLEVDHRNHNGLDNRRINIWNATHSENMQNIRSDAKKPVSNTGISNISWIDSRKSYYLTMNIGGAKVCRSFKDLEEAKRIRTEILNNLAKAS